MNNVFKVIGIILLVLLRIALTVLVIASVIIAVPIMVRWLKNRKQKKLS
jgi:hypothetical protein